MFRVTLPRNICPPQLQFERSHTIEDKKSLTDAASRMPSFPDPKVPGQLFNIRETLNSALHRNAMSEDWREVRTIPITPRTGHHPSLGLRIPFDDLYFSPTMSVPRRGLISPGFPVLDCPGIPEAKWSHGYRIIQPVALRDAHTQIAPDGEETFRGDS